eukprot:evm.model.scf_77.7 EVM.evm.TU.scf_77.7   scf_77:133904-141766(+)
MKRNHPGESSGDDRGSPKRQRPASSPSASSSASDGPTPRPSDLDPPPDHDRALPDTEGDLDDEDEEEDGGVVVRSAPAVRTGAECPYLDTVDRYALDFDFEKCCSVSLRPDNVYVCLVCGKYFQGRGRGTHAHTHALEDDHHMFMKLENGRVHCLPDNYEVIDRSLDDIRHVLNPKFSKQDIRQLDQEVKWSRALDGTEYMPGLVGLNNMKSNDYANVILQLLARVTPIRDYFLMPERSVATAGKSEVVVRFGELLRKMWNAQNFKGQVSPHEFMQAVMKTSGKTFRIDQQSDPLDFWKWFMNTLHMDLSGGRNKKSTIVSRCFQGRLEVSTYAKTKKQRDAMEADGKDPAVEPMSVQNVPFWLLGLDLPPPPLFKDPLEKNIIPQVPIYTILRKFDGVTVTDDMKLGRRTFRIAKLPRYLMLHMKRFAKNNFFIEKNRTIVSFPIKNLDLDGVVPLPPGPDGSKGTARYNLVANVCHEGGGEKAGRGMYRAHVHRRVEDAWYEVQDLRVVEILPQIVSLSETYLQLYELQGR